MENYENGMTPDNENAEIEAQTAPMPPVSPTEVLAARQMSMISIAIELWRLDRHMTITNFADYMGVGPEMVAVWESGEHDFTVSELAILSIKLDIQIEALFSGNRNISNTM